MALRNPQNPYALEAALALTKLAVAQDACLTIAGSDSARGAKKEVLDSRGAQLVHEIEKFYQTTATIGEIEDSELSPRLDVTWMQTLVTAHLDAGRGNYCKPRAGRRMISNQVATYTEEAVILTYANTFQLRGRKTAQLCCTNTTLVGHTTGDEVIHLLQSMDAYSRQKLLQLNE
ncbi:hypothetical protein PsorP6_012541 [Peronosclerospora sorghi]|uniref:Uncharacterized protein n=1 Tax=Peronosclerospora sorghi TaxID=230839 RepID=A0ACC0WHI2_9STRA|nr:hypothetical protein PsorP6_012541 [Peronosclerospora sorghi]